MTTVACVWVQGHVPFTAEYVIRLAAMVARHLQDRPYRFVCLTDRPWVFPGLFDTIPIQHDPVLKGWWAKLRLFDRSLGLTGRILYLDLDTLIVASLAPIVDYPAPFALVPHAGTFNGKDGLAVVKRFNSSVMVWDAGVNDRLFMEWVPAVARHLHGDQDWIGQEMPDAAAMPATWFPRLSTLTAGPPFDPDVKVILAKKPKNIQAAQQWPWFDAFWRAA